MNTVSTNNDNAARKPANHIPREYLAFRLGNEEYGIDILTVQEIRGYEISTQVANAPSANRTCRLILLSKLQPASTNSIKRT